jgi:hypothetical protein
MSKSIHTTRQDYRKAQDADFGSKKVTLAVLAAIGDELREKRTLKRNARRQSAVQKLAAPIRATTRLRLHEEDRCPTKKVVAVTIEEFGRGKNA